ncbi:hypothetical protein INT43_007026 [Umbelopsis isabellina]|uniref:Uncharacterized protein n=1 Tax=Mortierella isabellina TaxID=91625 RepID=A0A8H7PWU5_MORIS|nr:hypothetical protein INT43_007026 [Umbelopsis isabellina]
MRIAQPIKRTMPFTLRAEISDQQSTNRSEVNELNIMRTIDSSVAEQGVPQLDLNHKLQELESDNTKDRVQALLWISRNLQNMTMGEKTSAMKSLLKRVGVEIDNDTKCMIITLITKLITIPTQSSKEIFDAFIEQLHVSKSTKVKSQVYRGITKLLLVRELNWKQSSQVSLSLSNLCKFTIFELADTHHLIRAASIRLLSVLSSILHQVHQYEKERNTKGEKQSVRSRSESQGKTGGSPSDGQPLDIIEIQRIISHYVVDSDQRVRKSALEALVHMRLCGCPLDLSLYKHGVRALKDDFEDVRMGGLNLIWALGCLYPEYRMRLAHEGIDEEVRLLDDAFVKICDMVNDVAVNVRTKACTIMASFQHVDPNVLSQTFSKQIMSHNKRLARNKKAGGQKVTNRQSDRMIPVAEGDFDVESEEFRILDSGACGAFVHGLEDEYKEVRNASIGNVALHNKSNHMATVQILNTRSDSICELCMYSDQFTTKAVDFLVDMFNDEIDQVRINAIQSLRKIGTRTRLVFDEDQLEIVIGALEDADKTAREGTHDLLRVVRLSAQASLTILLESLKANMERYPEDQLSIYRCLKDMGRSHHDYIRMYSNRDSHRYKLYTHAPYTLPDQMVSDLLKYDKKYLPREANADDKNRKYLTWTTRSAFKY